MPRASVIIVNYNGKELILKCLVSLEKQSLQDFEVLVVDNGSSDGSLEEVRTYLEKSPLNPMVKLISLEKNIGFAGGNKTGLNNAQGEFIALLNNDTEAKPSWLKNLVSAMEEHPVVGICASKILIYGTGTIDSAGDGFSSVLKGFKRGEGEPGESYDREEYVFGACAGAALYRRRMIEEVGFLDEDFFLTHEDTDLNLRAQLFGWKVLYVPGAVVNHKVHSTIGPMSDLAVYHTLRNSELVRIKNIPYSVLLRYIHNLALSALLEFFYFAVRHARPGLYARAKYDALRSLPSALKKRRAVMAGKKTSARELKALITPIYTRELFLSKLKRFIG
jgi:GT2 family glycosyltransferase